MYFYIFTFVFVILGLGESSRFKRSEGECEAGSLICDDHEQCVSSEEWCDGKNDCADESDEAYCKEAGWFKTDPNDCKKSENHFLCNDGNCVPKHAKCNGNYDCKDESDEYFTICEETTVSTSTKTSTTEIDKSENESDSTSEEEKDEDYILKLTDNKHSYILPSTTASTSTASREISSTTPTVSYQSPSIPNFYDQRMKENDITNPKPPTLPPALQPTRATTAIPQHRIRHPNAHHSHNTDAGARNANSRSRLYVPRNYYGPSLVTTARPPTYSQHGYAYDSSLDRRHLTYGNQFQQNYNQPQPIDPNNPSIFVNSPYSSYEGRRSRDYNRESYWTEVPSSKTFSRETKVNKPFYFAKDYATLFGRNYVYNVQDAASWLLRQRQDKLNWGKNTARALTALALANNSFPSGNSEYELMKRSFIVQLSIDLLKNDTTEFTINRLASSSNALLAVCENPQDFHGIDLTELLRARMAEESRRRGHINPFVYMSLCLAGKNLTSNEIHHLMNQMRNGDDQLEITRDTQMMAIQAFSCYMHQQLGKEDHAYRMSLQEQLDSAIRKLLQRMLDNGSFGSVYSTALAAQALVSVNTSMNWDTEKTFAFLKKEQKETGSFGDLLATYYVIPAISGRSLLYLRNIDCQKPVVSRPLTAEEIIEFNGPKHYVHYSIYIGYPVENSYSVRLLVPQGINFFDVMRVADHQNENFRFDFEEKEDNVYVYSVSGLLNDAEQGFRWHLYVKRDTDSQPHRLQTVELYTGDIRKFQPTTDQHIIYWYHAIGIRN